MSPAPSTTRSTRRAWSRGVLAGPVCFIAAVLVMCGGALWLPRGRAEIDHIVLPVVLFPLIWSALFFYTLLDRRLARAWAVTGVLVVAHAGLIAQHVMTTQAAAKPAAVAATPGATGATP